MQKNSLRAADKRRSTPITSFFSICFHLRPSAFICAHRRLTSFQQPV